MARAPQARRESDPTKGNIIGFLNITKQPGDDRPVFQGKLKLPGQEAERGFAVWAFTSEKSGETVLSGRAGESAIAQIDKFAAPERAHDTDTTISIAQKEGGQALEVKPHTLVMFTNKSKDAENQNRPDYWGYYNPGGNMPLMRLAAWARTDQRGKAMLTGSLEKDEPRRAMDAPEKPERHASHEHDDEHEDEHAM